MNKYEISWYKAEGEMLDSLYRDRQESWQKLYDSYELKFDEKIRDLRAEDVVKVSRFYPIVRQILGSVAHNYPVMAFNVEDEINAYFRARCQQLYGNHVAKESRPSSHI